MNLLLAGVVVLGAVLAWGLGQWWGVARDVGVGIFSGATTNTPALGAAQQVIGGLGGSNLDPVAPALGYAVSYPFGIVGIILVMLFLRWIFRPDGNESSEPATPPTLKTAHLRVTRPEWAGVALRNIPGLADLPVVVSRLGRKGEVALAKPEECLEVGDVLLVVGTAEGIEQARLLIGEVAEVDLKSITGVLTARRILVTCRAVLGKRLWQIQLSERFGVTVTRLRRGEVELSGSEDLKLQFGDQLTVVGESRSLDALAKELGNSVKDLNHPSLIPVFLGIGLGLLIGSLPLQIPGLPAPVKLGLAGGPLIAAMILSRIGHIGPLVWHIPENANFLLRGLGITLFLACVGLKGGAHFLESFSGGEGWVWMGMGAVITLVPLLVFGGLARLVMGLGYARLCGFLAGSMTDPPALAFAQTVCRSDAPAVAYATVYPLAMVLRILAAQVLVLTG
jgi:putative transport protein